MGMGILANSGYPNSAGEAIGKGVLGAQESLEQKELQKNARKNDRLKELLNLRYMNAMVQSMDPEIKKQLALSKFQSDAYIQSMKNAGTAFNSQQRTDADFRRMIGGKLMDADTNSFSGLAPNQLEAAKQLGLPVRDTSSNEDEDTDLD